MRSETGLALHGTEVKSLRLGKCSIKEGFIRIENGEADYSIFFYKFLILKSRSCSLRWSFFAMSWRLS